MGGTQKFLEIPRTVEKNVSKLRIKSPLIDHVCGLPP